MLITIYHIARNTFRECLRQPIYIILLLTGLTIIGTYPIFSWFVFRAQEKLVVDGSLATILVFGWVTAVLCASHTISREIETGTVMLILSKPVSRPVFIIAKMLGILGALTVFVWVMSLASLMALRMATDQFRFDPYLAGAFFGVMGFSCVYGGVRNYFGPQTSTLACALISIGMLLLGPLLLIILIYMVVSEKGVKAKPSPGYSFPESCAKSLAILITVLAVGAYFLPAWESFSYKWGTGPGGYNWKLVRELVLIMFAVWAMATLATALSTRLNLTSNLTVCAVMFILGLMSNFLYRQLLDLRLETLEQWMHSWFFLLVPILLIVWVAAGKHFYSRQNEKVRALEIHGSFFAVLLVLIGKGIYNSVNQVHLDNPAAWMRAAARTAFLVKNLAATVLYAVIPNWQNFWLADVVTKKDGNPIPFNYIGYSALYILFFIGMFTVLALILFQDREVGAQNVA